MQRKMDFYQRTQNLIHAYNSKLHNYKSDLANKENQIRQHELSHEFEEKMGTERLFIQP